MHQNLTFAVRLIARWAAGCLSAFLWLRLYTLHLPRQVFFGLGQRWRAWENGHGAFLFLHWGFAPHTFPRCTWSRYAPAYDLKKQNTSRQSNNNTWMKWIANHENNTDMRYYVRGFDWMRTKCSFRFADYSTKQFNGLLLPWMWRRSFLVEMTPRVDHEQGTTHLIWNMEKRMVHSWSV